MANYKLFNQILVSLVANVGSLMFGIALGWSSPLSGLLIEAEIYDFPISSSQFGWIVSMMPLGAACSCVFSGIMRKKIGTKKTFFIFGIPIIIGYGLLTLPLNVAMMMIGRFLVGISCGCYVFLLPLYVAECSSKEIRGAIGSLFQVMVNFGVLIVFIVGYFLRVTVMNLIFGILPIIYSIAFLLLPESPGVLISKNRLEEAEASVKCLKGKSYNFELELDDFNLNNGGTKENKKSFKEVFNRKSTRKALTLMLFLFFFFQMSGINVIMFYSTMILEASGMDLDAGISAIIVAAVQVCATFLATAFVDRFGRKVLLIASTIIMCISMGGLSAFFFISETNGDVSEITWVPLVSFSSFVVAFSFGMAPVAFIILAEIFAHDAKAYIAPITQVLSFFLAFVIGLTFPLLVNSIGFGITFCLFSALNAAGTFFVIFFIPETKNKSFSQIQEMLER